MNAHPRIQRLLLVVSILILCGSVSAGEVARDIVGIRLNMTKAQAEARLKEIGTFERDERKGQQIWQLRDDRFSHLIVAADKDDRIRFVTAVAREGEKAKRIRYSDIGDTKKARQAGDPAIKNFNYEWSLPAQGEFPEMLVIARGRDAEFPTTYSLKRVGEVPEAADKE